MKILNYGSLNIDYVFKVDHAVRPGESMAVDSPELCAGGKGLNQSVAAAKAGGEVYHAGKIGPEGRFLLETLKNAGVNVDHVRIDDSLRCGGAYIQVEPDGRNTMLIAGGANKCLTEYEIDETLNCFGEGDILMLQNEINLTSYIARSAKARGMSIVYNPSPITDDISQMPMELIDLLIVNEDEGAALSGEKEPGKMLEKLAGLGAGTIVLTLGSKGSIGFENGKLSIAHAYPVNAVDTTGAGDTYTGYLVRNRFCGLLSDAMDTASRASAISVTRLGAAQSIPNADETANMVF